MKAPEAKPFPANPSNTKAKAWLLKRIRDIEFWRHRSIDPGGEVLIDSTLIQPVNKRNKRAARQLEKLEKLVKELHYSNNMFTVLKDFNPEQIQFLAWAVMMYGWKHREDPTEFVYWIESRFNPKQV